MILATMLLPAIIFVSILALIVGGFFAFRAARSGKGALALHLPVRQVASGQVISGTVTITTKKVLEARRFFVTLIGQERIEYAGDDGPEYSQVYSEERVLLEAQQLPVGMNETYAFEFIAPEASAIEGGAEETQRGLQVNIGGVRIGGGTERRLQWEVEARLDLPGICLLYTSPSPRD